MIQTGYIIFPEKSRGNCRSGDKRQTLQGRCRPENNTGPC